MSDSAGATGGLRAAAARFAATAFALVYTRLELASIELTEERERLKRLLVLLIAGVVAVAFALLAATLGVIAYFWETHRIGAIVAVTLFYALIGAIALWRLAELRRDAPEPFAATLAELAKDRQWLASGEPPSSP